MWRLVLAFVCLLGSASIALAFPQIVRHLLDAAFISADSGLLNRIALGLLVLFAIIFYWTPPHFWALALLKQRDYGNAGVPMAPLVWGERETMRQMMWYNVILIALTLLPATFGAFGVIYFVSALVLGTMLLVGVIRVSTSAEWTKPAWWVYKFSLLYLALLFAAMVVDRKVLGS